MSPAAYAAPPDGVAAIRAIEQGMAKAQTPDALTAAWDKNVVWYDINPGEVDGLEAVRKDFAGQVSHVTNIRVTILRMQIIADSALGFAFSTQHLSAEGRNGAPDIDFVFRETDCFQKKAGQWFLYHQQISLPVDMQTGRAVLESK